MKNNKSFVKCVGTVVVHNRRHKYMTNSLFDIAAHAFGVETYIYIERDTYFIYIHTHTHTHTHTQCDTHTFIHEFFNKGIMTIYNYSYIWNHRFIVYLRLDIAITI